MKQKINVPSLLIGGFIVFVLVSLFGNSEKELSPATIGENPKSQSETRMTEPSIGILKSNQIVFSEQKNISDILINNCYCGSNIFNCPDFSTHNEAQELYECCLINAGYDIHGLDRDNDKFVCETLP